MEPEDSYDDDYYSDDEYDDGTMPTNVALLGNFVVGHKIVKAEKKHWQEDHDYWTEHQSGLVLTLDNGTQVRLADTSDCCAFTEVQEFFLNPGSVDHVITSVTADGDFTRWHILADFGEIMNLTVGWSAGNPFYYSYGFEISVVDAEEATE